MGWKCEKSETLDTLFRDLAEITQLSQRKFVDSIEAFYKKEEYITLAQKQALDHIWRKHFGGVKNG